MRLERHDDDLDKTNDDPEGTLGHLPSTRREGAASLSLDGLVKNAETLQLLPNRSQCPPLPSPHTHPTHHSPTPLPLVPRPQQLQSGGCPKTPSHPYCFSPPGTLYAPRRTGHKGREDLRLLHLQVRGRVCIHPGS